MLGTLDRWIDETPPVDQPSRFGNKAYRSWYAKLEQVSTRMKSEMLTFKLFQLNHSAFRKY